MAENGIETEEIATISMEKRLEISGRIPSDSRECFFRSVEFCNGGNILVADMYNRKLKLFNPRGNVMSYLDLQSTPYDVALLTDVTAAVSFTDKCEIKIVSTKGGTLSTIRDLPTKSKFTWITKYGADIIGLCDSDSTQILRQVSIDGVESDFATDDIKLNDVRGLRYDNNTETLFMFDRATSTVAVYGYSTEGIQVSSTKIGDFRSLCGMAIDDDRNIYICADFRVLKTSHIGHEMSELDSKPLDPLGVAVSDNGSKIVVVGHCDMFILFSR